MNRHNKLKRGKAIFLNGPSSSGKSSIATTLQEKLSEPYMHIGIDTLISMMPAHLNDWKGGTVEQGFYWNKKQQLQLGPYAQLVNQTFKDIVVTMLNNGLNIIIDEVCLDHKSFKIWQETLLPFKCLYIGIQASLSDLEQREKTRPDRMPGSAKAQYNVIHRNNEYDLIINTSVNTMEENIDLILNKMVSDTEELNGH